jgi:RES domain-containing protein
VCTENLIRIDCASSTVEDVVDLRTDDDRNAAGVTLVEMQCPWRLDLAEGRTPASWRIAERLRTGGSAGILVPFFANRAPRDGQSRALEMGTRAAASRHSL